MAADADVRQLRRLLEMQAAARHGMSNAALGGVDPAETAFIEEELDRMGEIRLMLTQALDRIETAPTADIAGLVETIARLRQETPWADSDILDQFIRRHRRKG